MEHRDRILIKDHSADERCPLCKRLSKKSIRRNQELNEFMANRLEEANMCVEIDSSRFQPLDSGVSNRRVLKSSVQDSTRLIQTEEINGDIVKKLRESVQNQESDSWSDSETHLPLRAKNLDNAPERGRKPVKKAPPSENDQKELSPIRIPIKLHKKKKNRQKHSQSDDSNSELQWISLERHP